MTTAAVEPAMLTATEIAGFVGAGLAGAAYVPQIIHLIRARCSAGISRMAFAIWLLASLLTTGRAIAVHDGVFMVLGGTQIVATTLIMVYAARYKETSCPVHIAGRPGTQMATRRAPEPTDLAPCLRPAGRLPTQPRPPGLLGQGAALSLSCTGVSARSPFSLAGTDPTRLKGTT